MSLDLFSFLARLRKTNNPPVVEKGANPLRFGLLGAAKIAPDAIVKPIQCHEDAVLVAVAARDQRRVEAFGRKWGIPKTYDGSNAYQDLLDNTEIDAVYVALPNALHYEWTMKALTAGKHVLCEKPIANNEEEAHKMFALAQEKNLLLIETWQPHFHPAVHRTKEIIEEGALGKIVKMEGHLCVWSSTFGKDDIRFKYGLGGGALMDLGPYPINLLRYLSSSEPTVESATTICRSKNIDKRVKAHLTFAESIPAVVIVDSGMDGWGPLQLLPPWPKVHGRVECENGTVEIFNYPLPSLYHSITVTLTGGKAGTERVWKPQDGRGEGWWSAYRYQLEAFIDKVRGREPQAWRTAEDSINSMRIIDAIYTKSGLPLRQTSQFEL
ncbi:hypothetical protein BKA93DRAFT_810137 [Sparassis latifolia]